MTEFYFWFGAFYCSLILTNYLISTISMENFNKFPYVSNFNYVLPFYAFFDKNLNKNDAIVLRFSNISIILAFLLFGYIFEFDIKNSTPYLFGSIFLITLSFIDFKFKAVPDIYSTTFLIFSILLFNPNYNLDLLLSVCLVMGVGFFLKLVVELFFQKEGFGEADIIIIGIIYCFLQNFNLLFSTIYIAAVLVLLNWILLKIMKKDIKIFPFIPYLTIATFIVCFLNISKINI